MSTKSYSKETYCTLFHLGLRSAVVFSGALMLIGSAARCIPWTLGAFTLSCHMCAILNGAAGVVIFSAPSALSAAWFPPEERTTATGIAIVFNNLGNALSFLAAPAIVPDPQDVDDDDDDDDDDVNDAGNATEACYIFPGDELKHIRNRIDVLMYLGKEYSGFRLRRPPRASQNWSLYPIGLFIAKIIYYIQCPPLKP